MNEYLLDLISGRIGKSRMRNYLLSLLLIFFTSLLLAELFFPGGYDPTENFISDHGMISANPTGAYFFIIGVGLSGLLLIPYFMFIYQRTKTVSKIPSTIALISGIAGCIGLSMVGFFPKGGSVNDIHNMGSFIAWRSLLISTLATSLALGIEILKKKEWPGIPRFILVEGIVFLIGINVFIIGSGSLQQWTAFLTVISWFVGVYFLLPGRSGDPISS